MEYQFQSPVKIYFQYISFNPLTFSKEQGVTLSNDGVGFDGSQPVTQTISIGQPCRN